MMTLPLLAPASGGVLVASPSSSLREQVLLSLHDRPWPVHEVAGGADALAKLETGDWQLLFLDRCLPDLDTEELAEIIKRRFPGIQVVVVDSDGVRLPAGGENDFLPQFTRAEDTKQAWPKERSREKESGWSVAGREGPGESGDAEFMPLPGMIGETPVMRRLYRLARLVAPRSTTVLVTGPTGTGKELVARAIHQLSPRSARAFAVVNCAAIPEALLESELFGYSRGAFTGAVQAYAGRIQAAQGGTLFLDEVGDLPLSLQAKLLRFLDHKEVQRLGSCDAVRVDVRVVAATNLELEEAVEAGRFRGDLFYRLSAFPLHLPPLAERLEDVVPMAEHFLKQIAAEARSRKLGLGPDAMRALLCRPWEGNVRELQQVMERAAILAGAAEVIEAQHLYFPSGGRRLAAGQA